jgi:hypothetical protein
VNLLSVAKLSISISPELLLRWLPPLLSVQDKSHTQIRNEMALNLMEILGRVIYQQQHKFA